MYFGIGLIALALGYKVFAGASNCPIGGGQDSSS